MRTRVEHDPDGLADVRSVLQPVEDELWAEADEVFEHPGRWAVCGATWGPRALSALRFCAR